MDSETYLDRPVPPKAGGYTKPEAARLLGLPYRTVWNASRRGQVKTVSFGGIERLPSQEVERLRLMFINGNAA